jgi:hypothetical protein
MPLNVNVGLSKKISRDYQSTGLSVNLTAELDATLLAKPEELQVQIDNLYLQAQSALERQVKNTGEANGSRPHGNTARPSARANQSRNRAEGNWNGNGNGNNNGHARSNGGSSMTESQRRAIDSIARRLDIDPNLEAREIIGSELDSLSIRQASELIDHLKSIEAAGNGHNGSGR